MTETIGVSDLRAAGFTSAQFERLTALKALYPLSEFVVAREQFERLAVITWLHANSDTSLCPDPRGGIMRHESSSSTLSVVVRDERVQRDLWRSRR